jgi:hypothetical protein
MNDSSQPLTPCNEHVNSQSQLNIFLSIHKSSRPVLKMDTTGEIVVILTGILEDKSPSDR